jgi:hypothetical protein
MNRDLNFLAFLLFIDQFLGDITYYLVETSSGNVLKGVFLLLQPMFTFKGQIAELGTSGKSSDNR